jgi:hypothetical protein
MRKALKWTLIALMALGASWTANAAHADDVANASATNVQVGDNENETEQSGSASSGDAVAGQVAGVVSSGDASVDATNRSEDVDVETGDATGTNDATSFVGLTGGSSTALSAADDNILNGNAANVQLGDNEYELAQDATATTGDGVGGQVIGVVTSAGGSADVVAANTSEDVDIETGDADANNDAAAFVGLNATGTAGLAADDILNASATNVQVGDNELEASQDANSASGDGVGGSVIGVVSAGDASVDATNHSEDVEVETGDADSTNDFAAFVGLTNGSTTALNAADILNGNAANVQEGDNAKDLSQSADATSGDAVAGQVAGVVTSAGGSADLVLANTSEDSDAESGDGEFDNSDESFTGLNASGAIAIF